MREEGSEKVLIIMDGPLIIIAQLLVRKGSLKKLSLSSWSPIYKKWQLNSNNNISTQYLYTILIWTFVINSEGDSEWKKYIVYNNG